MEKGPPSLPSGFFFPPPPFQRGRRLFGERVPGSRPVPRGSRAVPPAPPCPKPAVSAWAASPAGDSHGPATPAADGGGDRSETSSASAPFLATRGHRRSGLGLTSPSSPRNFPPRSRRAGARRFPPAGLPSSRLLLPSSAPPEVRVLCPCPRSVSQLPHT